MATGKVIRNVGIGVLAIFAGLLVCVVVGTYTGAFNALLRAELSRQSQRYGVQLEMGTAKLRMLPLSVDLNDVSVRATSAPAVAPPLLRANRVLIGVRLLPLLRHRLELTRLDIDQPLVRIRIDERNRSNFAFASTQPPTTKNSGPGPIFDLEIQNCAIRSGEVYYNDAQVPLDAELHDLKLTAGYSLLGGEYKGALSYDRGRLSEPGLGPIDHDLQMEFTASPSALSISSLTVRSHSSEARFNGRMTDYANPVVEAAYHANVLTQELAAILKEPALPSGRVSLDGTLHYSAGHQPGPPQSFLAALTVEGQARSDRLSVSRTAIETGRGLNIDSVVAAYELKGGGLRVRRLGARVLGGALQAAADFERVDTNAPSARMSASLRGVSLGTIGSTFAPVGVQRIPFQGSADLQAQAAWTGPFSRWTDNLIANARLTVSAPTGATSSKAIPVSGMVLVDYNGRDNRISFGQSYLQTKATRVSIAGTLDARPRGTSAVTINAVTGDLREVSSLAAIIQGALQTGPLTIPIPGLSGSATLIASATGAVKSPRIQGDLRAQRLSIGDSRWRTLHAELAASPSAISIRNGSLTGEARQQITISGDAGLKDWAFEPGSAISLQGAATGFTVAEISQIAHLSYPLAGSVSANISLGGTKSDPEGKANVTVVNGAAWRQPFSRLILNGDFHQGTIHSTADVQASAGSITANATYTLATEAYSAQLHGASLQLAKIAALDGRDIQGVAELSVTGSGTLDNPGIAASLAIPQLAIADQKISSIGAQVNIGQAHAKLAVHSVIDQGSVEGVADIDLTGSRNTTASLDVRSLPVAAVLANFLPSVSSKFGGQTELHVTLRGPLSTPERMEAHLQVPTLNVTYGVAKLALTRPLEADYRNGVFTVTNSRIQGTGTDITLGGSIPIKKPGDYSIDAAGTVDLGVVHEFASSIQSKGELDIHLAGTGGGDQPSLRGQIDLKNAEFSSDTLPLSVAGLNGEIAVSGAHAVISNLSGTVGGGKLSATGTMDLGRTSSFNFDVNAQSVRLRYPQGLRSVLSAQVHASGDANGSTTVGRVSVDSLSFTQQFDLANFAGSLFEDNSGAPPSALAQNMKLNVAVVSAQDLSLASNRLSVGGSANLTLIGTLAHPVIIGRLGLASGEVFFLGKRFEVQSGTIEFPNPSRTDPVLNLYITTNIEHYNVTLKLSGPVDRLRTSYTSDPSLSQADIIHLLAFGNTNAEAASAAPTTATQSAEAVVASGVTSQVTGKLQSLTGISQLTIDPLSANTQGDPGAVIGIQQRVTGSLLFTYSTNVTDTQAQTVALQYDLSKQVSVTVLRDQNGGYGIDVRIHKVF